MRPLLVWRVLPRLLWGFPYLLPAVPREVADEFVECVFRCPVRNLNEQVDGAKRTPLLARRLDGRLEPSLRHRARQVLTFLSSIIRCTRRPDDDVGHPRKDYLARVGHMSAGGSGGAAELEAELIAHCRARLGGTSRALAASTSAPSCRARHRQALRAAAERPLHGAGRELSRQAWGTS